MAIKSMTGYGQGRARAAGLDVQAELSAVNRKQLDVRVSLPRTLIVLESRVLEEVRRVIHRGCVSGSIDLRASAGVRGGSVRVDHALARDYVSALREAADRNGLSGEISAGMLLQFPDVLKRRLDDVVPDDVWPGIRRALRAALKQLIAARVSEGRHLATDVSCRLDLLEQYRSKVEGRAPGVTRRCRQVLMRRLREAGLATNGDDPQLARELVIFSERSDITEELIRLTGHLTHGRRLLKATVPVGREFDFLVQEVLRESNTIASKSNDGVISRTVIAFKSELERIREQIQNIE